MGGNASKANYHRERELPYSGLAARPLDASSEAITSSGRRGRGRQERGASSTSTSQRTTKQPGTAEATRHKIPASRKSTRPSTQPWTPGPQASPHSTTFTVSTADSVRRPGRASSSSSSSLEYMDLVESTPPPSSSQHPHHRRMSDHAHQAHQTEDQKRIIEAEKILGEIAKEYAAKRAAGLVPTKPVPARTLLWEELAKNRTQPGRRGQCIFGRDSETADICGCTTYKKKRLPHQENTGGICECCNHGAVWHRLVGGTMTRSSRLSRSVLGSTSARPLRLESNSYVPSEARSSLYEYDSDEYDDDDDDEDDEAIANEMAMPSSYAAMPGATPASPALPTPPAMQFEGSGRGGGGGMDRLSFLSMGSSYGFPSRLSSATNSLGALLQAIQRYRDMGLDEDEIEARIRSDFPPVPRKSSVTARSDVSQSQVDI